MANERRDPNYANKSTSRCLIHIGVLMVVGLCVIPCIEGEPRYFSPLGWAIIAIWSVILIAGILWINALKRDYRCPKCGTPLPMMKREASTEYEERFHCDRCQVTWTTGVFIGDG